MTHSGAAVAADANADADADADGRARPGSQDREQPWEPAGAQPTLCAGEVHVWWAALDDPAAEDVDAPGADGPGAEALAPAERERARALAGARARRRWTAGRAGLRTVLAGYLGCTPSKVALATGPAGKPRLDGGAPLRFSVSHTGGHALYALGLAELGVDVELARERPRMRAIAGRFLDAGALARIDGLIPEQRERELLRAWVRREAAVKCLGTGLAGARDGDAARLQRRIGGLWIGDLPPLPGPPASQAAVAARERPHVLRCFQMDGP